MGKYCQRVKRVLHFQRRHANKRRRVNQRRHANKRRLVFEFANLFIVSIVLFE